MIHLCVCGATALSQPALQLQRQPKCEWLPCEFLRCRSSCQLSLCGECVCSVVRALDRHRLYNVVWYGHWTGVCGTIEGLVTQPDSFVWEYCDNSGITPSFCAYVRSLVPCLLHIFQACCRTMLAAGITATGPRTTKKFGAWPRPAQKIEQAIRVDSQPFAHEPLWWLMGLCVCTRLSKC